jgi:hypothetical protein
MKAKIFVRYALIPMFMVLLLISTISCKKEAATSALVGKWLLIAAADDDNGNKKVDDSEWNLLTKSDYDALKFFGFTGEVIFNADGTGNLVSSTQSQFFTLKWRVKGDSNFEIYDNVISLDGTSQSVSSSDDKLFIDAKGELISESISTDTVSGTTTTTLSFNKFKKI